MLCNIKVNHNERLQFSNNKGWVRGKPLQNFYFGIDLGVATPSPILFSQMQHIGTNFQSSKHSRVLANAMHSEIVQNLEKLFDTQSSKSIRSDLSVLFHSFLTHEDISTWNPIVLSNLLSTVQEFLIYKNK